MTLFMKKEAVISSCDNFRYTLERIWDDEKPYVNFIGLNPSTADAYEDDPTIRRCISFAKDWKYGGLVMTNLFSYRATHPEDMMKLDHDAIGERNNGYIKSCANNAGLVIASWGIHGGHLERDERVLNMLASISVQPYCLGVTKGGFPRHPLYIKSDTIPMLFKRR